MQNYRKMLIDISIDAGKTAPKAMGIESLDFVFIEKKDINKMILKKTFNEKTTKKINYCDCVIVIKKRKEYKNKIDWMFLIDMGIALQKMIEIFLKFGVDFAIDYSFSKKIFGEKTISLFLSFGKSKNELIMNRSNKNNK